MSLVSMCSDASCDERRYSSPLKKLRSKPPAAAALSKTTTTPPPNLEQNFVKQANQGLRRYSTPSLTPEGTGGAYIIRSSSGRNLAVYKPSEEEAFAPNNPRGFVSSEGGGMGTLSPLRPGFRIGWGFTRERAVYMMDRSSMHQAGVPLTVSVRRTREAGNEQEQEDTGEKSGTNFPSRISSPSSSARESCSLQKPLRLEMVAHAGSLPTTLLLNGDFASLQQYCPHAGTMEEYGTTGVRTEQAQLIACLDMRCMNQDRHGANILVTGARGLVPIDHGFALPSYLNLGKTTFFWSTWPQILKQLMCPSVISLIASLDSKKDAVLLRQCGINDSSIVSMRIGTKMLKLGVEKGMNLGQISCLCLRSVQQDASSKLEMSVKLAQESVEKII